MTDIARWRKLGGDLAAKPGCENTECYGEICVEPERCYAEAIELVPYRPLGANERYCPACGADTLQRAPDGTEYFGGHGEADCYRRRLVFALAELQAARAEAEALRKRIEALEAENERLRQIEAAARTLVDTAFEVPGHDEYVYQAVRVDHFDMLAALLKGEGDATHA